MGRTGRISIGLIAALLLARPGGADEELDVRWSATLDGTFKVFEDQEADDGVSGFFDQYEYTPNKSDGVPFQLGIPEASLDVFGEGDTPRLQFRLESPTSNLGVTGRDIDRPFLNQRADILGRQEGVSVDLDYRRFRTDELRFYPLGGIDLTSGNDRFYTERTGFLGGVRLRFEDLIENSPEALRTLAPELTLRGGYQARNGQRQLGFYTNNFVQGALTQELDQGVGDVGAGLLLAPGGLFTMVFDFDHQRFRENAPAILESDLGTPFSSTSGTVGFIPDTDRSTGSIRLHSRIGERAVLEGGFQVSHLEQVDDFTPWQRRDGLSDNELMYYSANLAADVQLAERFSANAFFKYDRRDNDIQRDTLPFNVPNRGAVGQCGGPVLPGSSPVTYCQATEFVDRLERIVAGLEFVYQPISTTRLALGARGEWVERDLDFVQTPTFRILPSNALMSDDTEMWTVYGRARLVPARGLGLRGEIGYRGAPKTGYITQLDDYVYGKARVTYALPIEHPVVLTAFGQGSSGRNRDFDMVDGQGPVPTGPRTPRDFDRYGWMWGLTASTALQRDVGLYASFFQSRDAQDYDLVTSDRLPAAINGQRYLQDLNFINFAKNDEIDYSTDDLSLVAGSTWQATAQTDLGLSYAFTRARTTYEAEGPTSAAIGEVAKIDSSIHRVYFDVGHWVMEGLRVGFGYRFDLYDDRAFDANAPTTSNVAPFDPSTHQHTVTLRVTMTNDLLAGG
jgi:hypothetical protein